MSKINKISMTVLAIVAMVTTSVMAVDVVTQGTFDTLAEAQAAWGNNGGGVATGGTAPISGGNAWFNDGIPLWIQTVTNLTPNTLYELSFDAYSGGAAQTIVVGLRYTVGIGNASDYDSDIAAGDILNLTYDSTWAPHGNPGYISGGTFSCPLNPVANAPEISHFLQFNTPNVLNGAATSIGVDIRQASGIQVRLDNVVVEVTPIPEPATIGLLSLLGLALLRR